MRKSGDEQAEFLATTVEQKWMKALKLLGLSFVAVFLVATVQVMDLRSFLTLVELRVGGMGAWASWVLVVICGVWGLLCLPGPLMQTTVGALFAARPLIAWGIVLGGEALAQAVAFSLTRTLAQRRVRERLEGKPWFERLDAEVKQRGPYAIALFRLMPFVPNAMASYALGLTSIRFWPYLGASVLGSAPKMAGYVFGTTKLTRLFLEGRLSLSGLGMWILVALGTMGLVAFRRRQIRKVRSA